MPYGFSSIFRLGGRSRPTGVPALDSRNIPPGTPAAAGTSVRTRERILQAAAAIARREGLQAASIPRVMRAAGLTVGGFYGHFASKTALDVEVIRTVVGAIPGRGLAGLEHVSGLAWVERATTRYLTVAHRDNPDRCSYPAILSGVATGSNDVKAAFAAALECGSKRSRRICRRFPA
jgi:TetR/AcrR family transcriptional repressor of nem operon